MLLQIVDSVAKEEIVVGSCAVGDLIENNNATFAVEDHKSMEKQLSLSCGVTEYEDECEEKNKSDWNDSYNLELTLHSPVGGESLIYKWPLVLGDERDESLEILETIRWACRDTPELENMIGKNEFHAMYDPRSYQGMKKLCDRFNGAINTLRQLKWITEKSPPTPSSSSSSTTYQFASTGLLKHILQVCYNRAVEDPDKLNQYEPFSPEVYGETSFELVEELTKVTKFGEDDVFIDLGSGVGQVVLQIASSTPCKFCYGIEKSDWPAKYSESLSSEFKKLMSFFGKYHSMFRLEKGDFLGEDKVEVINSASIIFVNNFAFGPQVDHQLKLRFANVKEGARIVSSRAFCPLNFHITDRNLSDIGTIMKVEELTALPAAVSWTDKPFAYFLHTIDRSLLEKYFNNLKTNSETGTRRVIGNERNKRKFINGGSVKSESGDDAVKNKKPRKQLNGETDSGVETIGNQENKMTLDQMLVCDKRKYKLKLKKGPTKKGFTVKRGRKKLNSNTLNTLDMFHRQISSGSNSFDEPSKGIFNDHWMLPQQTREDQITTSHLHGAVGPLKNLMAVFERQMMFFLQHMQTSTFKDNLRKEVEFEQKRNAILLSKISNLKMEVQLLRKQGSDIIERKMSEASQKKNISDLLNETNSVMASKTNLERQVSHLKEQVTQLEHEQKQITNFHQPRNNGNLPTLHDLLTSPMNAPPRLTATSSAYKTFHQVKDQPEANNLLLDLTEMLVRKNLQSGLPVEPSSKKPIKRSRTSNCSEIGTDPIHKSPRKKAKSMEDNNNNSTLLPSSNQFDNKSQDHVRLMQQQPSGEQQKLTSRQQKHRTQTNQMNKHATVPMNVPSDIHPQVLHQQQIMRQHQLDQQNLKLHAQQLPSLHHSKNLHSSCERLPVTQEQQSNGHFPYKFVSNETATHSSPLNLPPSFEDPNKTSIDKITPQAPFMSKLAAPNFAVVDFSQLIKSGGMPQPLISTKHLPLELPPSSFPLPPHIFPPPNFMLLKPPMGSTGLMSPLSKPLFSSFPTSSVEVPSASFGNTSFISFSSPLLSLPLFQPTNLISTSMACTSKLSKSHSTSAINSASSPLSKDQLIKISPEPAATTTNRSHESSTQPGLETLDGIHVKEDSNKSLDDSTPLKPSSGKLLEGHSCKGEKIGINEFTDNRKEVLASQ